MSMNFNDLTRDQIKQMLIATQSFIDGDFYSAGDIHYQTGLPLADCEGIAKQFSLIRSTDFQQGEMK